MDGWCFCPLSVCDVSACLESVYEGGSHTCVVAREAIVGL